jgi:hypothetical protein
MDYKKVWTDPVWSKVIAAIIIAIGSIIFTIVYSKINNTTFQNSLINFIAIKFPLWFLIILISVFLFLFKVKRKTKKSFKYDDETLKLDKQVYEKLRQLLPQNGSINKIRYFHSSLGFTLDEIEDIEEFEDYSKYSDFEFLNPELESLKNELVEKVENFTMKAYFKTRLTDEKRRVHPTREEDLEKNRINTNDIDKSAKEVFLKYDELIKLGRRILKI